MPAVVRLLIGDGQPSTIRLPEVPTPGELIELPDGTRVVVRSLERTQGNLEAIVTASPTRWEPSRRSGSANSVFARRRR